MAKYEYQMITQVIKALPHLNKHLNQEVEEGWEPVSFTGDQNITVLMRRLKQPVQAAPQQPAAPQPQTPPQQA